MADRRSDLKTCGVLFGVGAIFGALGISAGASGWEAVRLTLRGLPHWKPTPAKVLEAEVDWSMRDRSLTGGGSVRDETMYAPKVRYEYSFGAKSYISDRYSLVQSYSYDEAAVRQKVATEFAVGGTITVYVDPDNPAEAVIERGNLEGPVVLAGIGAVFALGGLVMLIAGLVVVLRMRRGRHTEADGTAAAESGA